MRASTEKCIVSDVGFEIYEARRKKRMDFKSELRYHLGELQDEFAQVAMEIDGSDIEDKSLLLDDIDTIQDVLRNMVFFLMPPEKKSDEVVSV